MAKVLIAWELGANYGHLFRLLPLAIALRERGHEPVFVLRNLARVEQALGPHGFDALQAPVWLANPVGLPSTLGYPDILMRSGYLDADGVTALVRAWRKLFSLIQPDLLVADHSPTALLASIDQDIPRVLFGSGFSSPPRVSPMPSLRWWEKTPVQQLINKEQKVLVVVNQVLHNIGLPPLETLADMLAVDDDFLSTFPELDHYTRQTDARYYGPPFNADVGVEPCWPLGEGKRIFAYVYPEYEGFERLMQAFRALPCRTLIHAPGISNQQLGQYQSANVAFAKHPVNIVSVREQCDLTITHSGVGTGSAILLAGRPVLLLPRQLEQLSTALRIAKLGAGLLVRSPGKHPDYKKLLQKLLTDPAYTAAARAFADKYSEFDQLAVIAEIADRCNALIEEHRERG